jgi:hypothetical protein
MEKKYFLIVGLGRSGTTIIGQKLSEFLGARFVGELIYVSSRGLVGTSICGCGKKIWECDYWNEVISLPNFNFEYLKKAESDLRFSNILRKKNSSDYRKYFSHLHDIISRNNMIVDTSKIFAYALLFRNDPRYIFIHVVRDPVDVTASMMSPKYVPDSGKVEYLHNGGLLKTPIRWLLINWLVRLFLPIYREIRYEEFVRDPEQTLRSLELEEHRVEDVDLEIAMHSLAGNPSRFEGTEIRKQGRRKDFSWLEIFWIRSVTKLFVFKRQL